MATRKQVAAARRNLRKARAALKRAGRRVVRVVKRRRKGRTKNPFQWGYPESAFAPGRHGEAMPARSRAARRSWSRSSMLG